MSKKANKIGLVLVGVSLLTFFACGGIKLSQQGELEPDSRLMEGVDSSTVILPDTTPKRLTLLFAGDLMQHQGQINAAKTDSGYSYKACFAHVKELISKADIAIGNFEVTLGGQPYKGYPCFSAPDEYFYDILDAGFDVMLTANNHCLDKGKKGLERTIHIMDSLRVPQLGTYLDSTDRANRYPLLVEKNGIKVALLNYTYGTNGINVTAPNVVNYIDTTIISADIEKAKNMKPDLIIANMHWGVEYQTSPHPTAVSLSKWLFGKGVDHVIGGHPHVIQPIVVKTDSVTGNKQVLVYSLGNYISNMTAPNTEGGLMVTLSVEKRGNVVKTTDASFSKVFTARPTVSGLKVHTLFPAEKVDSSLNLAQRARMQKWINDANAVMKHNVGIEEKY